MIADVFHFMGALMIRSVAKKSFLKKVKQPNAGFSLFELAIIIGLFGIAMTAVIAIYNHYSKQVAYTNTMARRVNTEAALGRFYALHNRLPCPADNSLPEADPMAGVEQCATRERILNSGTTYDETRYAYIGGIPLGDASLPIGCDDDRGGICRVEGARPVVRDINLDGTDDFNVRAATAGGNETVLVGGVPYATLGLSPSEVIDGYGGRLTYAVTEFFAGNAMQATDPGQLAVLQTTTNPPQDIRDYGGAIAVMSWMEGAAAASAASSSSAPAPMGVFTAGTAGDASNATINYFERSTDGLRVPVAWTKGTETAGFAQMSNPKAKQPPVAGPTQLPGNPARSFGMALVSHGPDGKGAFTSSGAMKRPCGTGFAGGADSVNCGALSTFISTEHLVHNIDSGVFYDDTFVSTTFKDQNDRWEMVTGQPAIKTQNVKMAIGKTTVRAGASVDVQGIVRAQGYVIPPTGGNSEKLVGGALHGDEFKNIDVTNGSIRGFQPALFGGQYGVSCAGGITKGLKPRAANDAFGEVDCEQRLNLDNAPINFGDCASTFGAEFTFFVGLTPEGHKICRNTADTRNDTYCTDLHNQNPNLSFRQGECAVSGEVICGGPPGATTATAPPQCPSQACYNRFNPDGKPWLYSATQCSVYNTSTNKFTKVARCRDQSGSEIVRMSDGEPMMECPATTVPTTIGSTIGNTMPVDGTIGSDGDIIIPGTNSGPGGGVIPGDTPLGGDIIPGATTLDTEVWTIQAIDPNSATGNVPDDGPK